MKTKLTIITPDGIYLEKDVDMVNIKTLNGHLGLLHGHMPIVTKVEVSSLEIVDDAKKQYFATSDGFLKADQNSVILLLSQIESVDDIDEKRARQAIEHARQTIEESDDPVQIEKARLTILKNENRLNLLAKANLMNAKR